MAGAREAHPSSKLTDSEVRTILDLKGKASQSVIGELFGTCRSNVGQIHSGQRRL